ncbi:hypothetical protein ABIB51_002864 [Arthrobacter sp. UYCu712]
MGITTIGLADTLCTTPTERAIAAVGFVLDAEPELNYSLHLPLHLHLHLHNAHGQALATVSAAINLGITRFDSALGGYGGCSFAPGAVGNLATEGLVRHLHAAGHDTGIDEALLAETVAYARDSVTRAQPFPAFPLRAKNRRTHPSADRAPGAMPLSPWETTMSVTQTHLPHDDEISADEISAPGAAEERVRPPKPNLRRVAET